jgi:molybdate transport system substrate-binding protein
MAVGAVGLVLDALSFGAGTASAAQIKVLTGGAYRGVVVAAVPAFERSTGHKVMVVNDTVGALVRRVGAGEDFDLIIVTPEAIERLAGERKVLAGTRTDLAKVGVGVMVKTGVPVPVVDTVEAFRRTVLAAASIAYIDPESGGSSGIYVAELLERLGIADQVKARTRLKRGGHVSDYILSGEAELGIHQMSEIVSTPGVSLAGPLPADIQNYTTYAAAVGSLARDPSAAEALIRTLSGPAAGEILTARGMQRP